MSDSAENDGSDEVAASASANASAAAGGGPSGGGDSADNPTVPPLGPATMCSMDVNQNVSVVTHHTHTTHV